MRRYLLSKDQTKLKKKHAMKMTCLLKTQAKHVNEFFEKPPVMSVISCHKQK